jgi:hypothetical protein
MPVPWIRQLFAGLSLQTPRFDPKPVYVGFVVDIKCYWEMMFSECFGFTPTVNIPLVLNTHFVYTCCSYQKDEWVKPENLKK